MTQHVTVIGDPIPCDHLGCNEPAVVYLREERGDGDAFGVAYCEDCWLRARRAYAPLVAHDAVHATREAVTITRGSDDDTDGVLKGGAK